jgi:hypothetical protein
MSLATAPTSTINILIGQQQQQQPTVAVQQLGILNKLLSCFAQTRDDPNTTAATILPTQFITKVTLYVHLNKL